VTTSIAILSEKLIIVTGINQDAAHELRKHLDKEKIDLRFLAVKDGEIIDARNVPSEIHEAAKIVTDWLEANT
jgi:hypothetical protein